MKPRTHITHTLSSRPTGGFFISAIFLEKTRPELTIVNKPTVINYESTNCKHPIFPAVKSAPTKVNKISPVSTRISPLTPDDSRLITLLTYCHIHLLTSCQFVEQQPPTPTFCPLFGTGKAFAITFADDFQKKA